MRCAGIALLAFAAVAGCAHPPPPRGFGPGGGHGRPGGVPPGEGRALFISPMGEPFRGTEGGSPARRWFEGADADHDGRLVLAELMTDADRFFTSLDVDGDGEIAPPEIDRYEKEVAPEIASRGGPGEGGGFGGRRGRGGGVGGHGGGMGGHRGGGMGGMGGMGGGGPGGPPGDGAARGTDGGGQARQGAGRFGYLPFPEPVVSADLDFNRGISRAEFARTAGQRFLMLDTEHRGYLTFDTLPPLGQGAARGGHRPRPPSG